MIDTIPMNNGNNITTNRNSSTSSNDNMNTLPDDSIFQMGDGIHTLRISVRGLFVANRQKVIRQVVGQHRKYHHHHHHHNTGTTESSNTTTTTTTAGTATATATTNIVIYIQGGTTQYRYDTDHEPIFRQESYFFYMCGVKEPDCALSIHIHIPTTNTIINDDDGGGGCTDTEPNNNPDSYYTSTTRLYIPNLPPEYATVMGPIRTKQEWKDMYLVDDVQYMTPDDNCEEVSTSSCSVIERYLLSDLFYPDERVVVTKGNVLSLEKEKEVNDDTNCNKILMVMSGRNTDSGNMYPVPELNYDSMGSSIAIDRATLYPIVANCRVIKSLSELYLLRYATEVTSFGHTYVMRNFTKSIPNTTTTTTTNNNNNESRYEYQGESLFRHYCYYNYGCRNVGYTPICGCGPNSAILHYGHAGRPNSDAVVAASAKKKESNQSTICLFDMGIEYYHYGSDVTCTFPSNGTFTPQQRLIYQGVLNSQMTVYQMMKPNVSWVDCHKAAESTILSALVNIGIVLLSPTSSSSSSNNNSDTAGTTAMATSKTIDELVEMRLGAVFMPHGLGHFVGLDTHDVGGYLPGHPPRIEQPGLRKLRTARILQANMVLTVEPGCYFIDHLLDEAMGCNSVLHPYLNTDLINEEYRNFGGIRLEDVVQVTEDGIINYTLCPRTIEEVEGVTSGTMKWPPIYDTAPELRRLRLTETNPLPSPPSL